MIRTHTATRQISAQTTDHRSCTFYTYLTDFCKPSQQHTKFKQRPCFNGCLLSCFLSIIHTNLIIKIAEVTYTVAGWIRLNKAYNRCLFTRLSGKLAPVHPAVWWVLGNSPGSCANNIYSPGSDKLTEVQLYMSASCQPGSRVIQDLSGVEKPFFLFADLVVKTAKLENKKKFFFDVREGSD